MTTYNGNKAQSREWIVKYHNIDYLYSLIQHYVYESDLQLNLKRQYITVDYNIDASELCEYQRLKQYYLQAELMQEKGNTIFMEMTTKMQQSYSTCKSKMHALRSIITSHHIEKILVYCKYISSADAVTKQFPSVRVMTYGKHSYGLNLQDYNVIIYYDRTWDYAQRLQSERRIFRTGQINDCTYYTMNGNVPLEKLIATNINRKIDILNHLKKLSIEQINKII
jgi:SNF2 family DNA or RNA helicase